MAYERKTPAPSPAAPQTLLLESRARLTLSGVSNVVSCEPGEVVMETTGGPLTIRGSELHMARLTLETGEAAIDGRVDAIEYTDAPEGGGFFARLFK